MAYITKSPEEPVGKVDNIWMKRELQETKGNVPHIHSILWLAEDDGTLQGVMKVVQCIRASISMMLSSDEYNEMKNQGILSSQEELLDILQTLSTILPHHHHRRCTIVKKQKLSSGFVALQENSECNEELTTYQCKVPDNRLLSPDPTRHEFIELQAIHSKLALEVLQKLDMIALPEDTDKSPIILDKAALVAR